MVKVVAAAVWKFMAFLNKAAAVSRVVAEEVVQLQRLEEDAGVDAASSPPWIWDFGMGDWVFWVFFFQKCELWIWDVNWGM
jgi:hypothetical protein